jgi:hypothetical protein
MAIDMRKGIELYCSPFLNIQLWDTIAVRMKAYILTTVKILLNGNSNRFDRLGWTVTYDRGLVYVQERTLYRAKMKKKLHQNCMHLKISVVSKRPLQNFRVFGAQQKLESYSNVQLLWYVHDYPAKMNVRKEWQMCASKAFFRHPGQCYM